jgi:site-specific DNA recombinase
MRRAAIYARYSTDLQNEKSIDDQFALCHAYAAREGLIVVETFADKALSGASMIEREGLLDLMALVKKQKVDAVIIEAIDRLSRDHGDASALHKRLTFHGIELHAVSSGGIADSMTVGFHGLMGQFQREEGVRKIRRGLAGVVRSGRIAGGLCYGYRVVPGKPGEREIDPEQAAIVRRIFEEYAAGRSPRDIAGDLNREGIAPHRARFWTASTINGFRKRGSGILLNELYVGRIVWNRNEKRRNPDTGRRVPRPNDPAERHIAEAPHLRIIDDELWQKVQAVRVERSVAHVEHVRRPANLLSGLLKCGCCGSGYVVKDRDKTGKTRIRCSAVAESGSCSNRRVLYLPAVEEAVVSGMREQLRDRSLIEIYLKRYNDERRQLAAAASGNRAKLESQLDAKQRERERALNLYIKGLMPEAEAEKILPSLNADCDRLTEQLASCDEPVNVVTLHPTVIEHYLRSVDELAATLSSHARAGEDSATKAFRTLVHSVVIYPNEPRQGFEVEVKGRLNELIGGGIFPARRDSGRPMVPQEGFEPPTPSLRNM